MALLAQIGVASDARRPGSGQGYDVTKLRGYLEIEEDSLDKALAGHFEAVRQLFGSDTDGDLIVNSGIAYALDTLLKPYVETGGILSLKTGTIDTRISSEKRGISTLEEKLAVKEAELKRKYGLMSSSLSNMENSANSIDRAFGQGSNQ
jgi:flagellar hook-associated protein 2